MTALDTVKVGSLRHLGSPGPGGHRKTDTWTHHFFKRPSTTYASR